MKIFFLLVFTFLCVSITNAQAEQKDQNKTYQEQRRELLSKLNNAEESGGYDSVNKLIFDMEKTPENINHLSVWLRDAYSKHPHQARYGLLYADSLYSISKMHGLDNLKETAAFAFFSSQVTARENVARCDDPTAGQNHIRNWTTSPLSPALSKYVRGLESKEKEKFVTRVLNYSNKRDKSFLDKKACGDGIKYMQEAIKNNACKDASGQTVGNNVMAKTQKVCDTMSFVGFIPDNRWQKQRQEIRSGFKTFLLSDK